MELKSTQISTTAKLPMLNQGDYEMRRLRIKQYSQYKDAKTLFAAIEIRFGGNEATKKNQKTLLNQLNKSDLDTMSIDDLDNNFKTVEQETGKKITINGSDTAGYDKTKVECFNYYKIEHFARDYRVPRNQESRTRNQETTRRTVNVEDTSSKAMVVIDGAGFDWSYMADDEAPTNMAFMAFSDSERETIVNRTNYSMVNHSANTIPKAVLTRTGLKPVNYVRPIYPKRHMTGNISYLTNFKEFDGGYVAFGGWAKGGKITGKGTIRTCVIDFEDVYFVKELQFKLFSVLQMCDKKNSVLFTDTECFVLSLDFKLANESHVLLKVSR
uniref:Ribonuclease H-like domain-containing protein n=1 Tax=Tanacetum cinerariifolium TaxID=118510 RepID=A0A6L2L1G8_TANCI|nr:ribonuclease H-like domain-containing protein [Tanacetum cinerariifolium]